MRRDWPVDPLDPAWGAAYVLLQPTAEDIRAMLAELYAAIGNRRGLSYVTGIPALTLDDWRYGRRTPDTAGKRVVWLLWAMLLHPERCRTLTDLASWGRFRTPMAAPCGVSYPPNGSQASVLNDAAPQPPMWFYDI